MPLSVYLNISEYLSSIARCASIDQMSLSFLFASKGRGGGMTMQSSMGSHAFSNQGELLRSRGKTTCSRSSSVFNSLKLMDVKNQQYNKKKIFLFGGIGKTTCSWSSSVFPSFQLFNVDERQISTV